MHPGGVPAHPSGQFPHMQHQMGAASHHMQNAPQQYGNSQHFAAWGAQPGSKPGSPPAQRGYMQPGPQQGFPAYGQPAAPGPSMASLMNPWNMISSVSQMGALELHGSVKSRYLCCFATQVRCSGMQ